MQPLEAVGSFLHRHAFVRNKKYKDSGGTDMYEKEVEQLQNIIDDSKRIVFFGGAGVSTESNIPISEVRTGYINKSINIRRSRS